MMHGQQNIKFVRCQFVPQLRLIVAGLSPQRPCSIPSSIHVGFVVDKVALGQISLPVPGSSPVHFITSWLRTRSTVYH